MANYSTKAIGINSQIGGGSGSGEKNYITNGSGATGVTGWAESTDGNVDITKTSTASELPRENTTESGLKIVSTTGATTDYVYFRFTLDDADVNKKMKIAFAQKAVGAYVSDDYNVEMYVDSTDAYASSTQVTIVDPEIKASTGTAVYTFDTTADLFYELRIVSTAASGAGEGIVLSDVVVGPGTIVTSAVVTEWQSMTNNPTGHTTNVEHQSGHYRRIGDSMEVRGAIQFSGVNTEGYLVIQMPTGFTPDTTKLANPPTTEDEVIVGNWFARDSGAATRYGGAVQIQINDGELVLAITNISGTLVDTAGNTPITIADGDTFSWEFSVPVVEWAGAGTVNLITDNVSEFNARGSFSTVGNMLVAADSTERVLPFEDSDSEFGGMTIDGAGIVTIPASGVYHISAQANDASTPDYLRILIYRNGASVAENTRVIGNQIGIEAYRYFDEGDTLGIYVAASGGGNISTVDGDRTWFTAVRVPDYTAGQAVGFGEATTDSLGLSKKNKWAIIKLVTDITASDTDASTTTDNSAFYFDNLVEGQKYELIMNIFAVLTGNSGTERIIVQSENNGAIISQWTHRTDVGTNQTAQQSSSVAHFIGTSDPRINFNVTVEGTGNIIANDTIHQTHAILREVHEDEQTETTDFT